MQSGQLEKNLFQSVYCILELTYVLLLTFKLTVFSFIFCYICGIDQACHNVFNRMKLDRMMKRKMPVGIYSSERTCSSMFLFTRRRSTHETMIVHVADRCSRKWSLVSHDSNFHPFYFAPFSPLSWSLMEQAYLDLKEFWVSFWDKKPQHPTHLSLYKALVPSK